MVSEATMRGTHGRYALRRIVLHCNMNHIAIER